MPFTPWNEVNEVIEPISFDNEMKDILDYDTPMWSLLATDSDDKMDVIPFSDHSLDSSSMSESDDEEESHENDLRSDPSDPSNVPFDSGDLDDLLDDLPDDFVLENEDLPDVSMASVLKGAAESTKGEKRVRQKLQKFAGKVRCCPREDCQSGGTTPCCYPVYNKDLLKGLKRDYSILKDQLKDDGMGSWKIIQENGKSVYLFTKSWLTRQELIDAKLPVCGGTKYSCMHCGDGVKHWLVESGEEGKLVLEKTYKRRQKKRKVAPFQLVKKRKAVSFQSVTSSKRRRREE